MVVGGTERVIAQMIEHLDRKRFNLSLCCLYQPGPLGERLIQARIPVYHGLAKSCWDFRVLARLTRLLKQKKVDVLFMINQPMIQFWGTWCGLLAEVPVRIAAVRSMGRWNRSRRRLWVNQLTLPWTTCVTALSETHKKYLVQNEGMNARKIEIVPNGVDPSLFFLKTTAPPLRESLRIPRESSVVGMVAMLRPEKGHTVFLQAASQILKKAPDTFFLIAGEGEERAKLEVFAKKLGIDSRVRFLGVRIDIPEFLSVFDVAVLSSHPVVEAFSNSVLEYMAAAKPVVATHVGSLRELVEEGKTGFLVEPGDWETMGKRILTLLQDRALAERMGRAGREKVLKEYTLDQTVKKTEALFEKLVRRKKVE